MPAGVFEGDGENRLTLHDPNWILETGLVTWTGTYRIEGSRLTLDTESIEPEAGHASSCVGAEEAYGWHWEGSELRLTFQGEPCNRNRRVVLTQIHWAEVS